MARFPLIRRLRRLCLALPGVVESRTRGATTFQVGRRAFAFVGEVRGTPVVGLRVGAVQQPYLLRDPRFARTRYGADGGWVTLPLEGRVDWKEVGDLLRGSHALVAQARASRGSRRVGRPRARPAER